MGNLAKVGRPLANMHRIDKFVVWQESGTRTATNADNPGAAAGGPGMDALSTLLEELKKGGQTRGNFLGFLNVLIGRRIATRDGKVLSRGLTWRELSGGLRKVRWDPDAVRELGLNPDDLPPRDRRTGTPPLPRGRRGRGGHRGRRPLRGRLGPHGLRRRIGAGPLSGASLTRSALRPIIT